MIELVLHTKPGAEKGQITVPMPDSWEELNASQLIEICHALYTVRDVYKRNSLIAKALIGKAIQKITPEAIIVEVFPLIEWTKEAPTLTQQLIPTIKAGRSKLYGPASAFENMRMLEFEFAERYLFLFLQNRDIQDLWTLVAILYRKGRWLYNPLKNKKGDIRVPFNNYSLTYQASKLQRKLQPAVAYAILQWYKGCRLHLMSLYPVIFQSNDSSKGSEDRLPTLFPIMRKIAEKGTYGVFEDVEQMEIHTFLMETEESIKEAEAMEAQRK